MGCNFLLLYIAAMMCPYTKTVLNQNVIPGFGCDTWSGCKRDLIAVLKA